MRRTWEWLGLNLGKHAGIVACVGLAVTFVLGIGLTGLTFSTGDSDYLNGNDPAAIGNREYTSLFGGDPIAVLFTMKPGTTVDDLLTPANQAEMERVDAALNRDPSVYDVISPITAFSFSSVLQRGSGLAAQMFVSAYERDRSAHSRALREAYAEAEARQLAGFTPAQESLSNPMWMHFILHEPSGSLRSEVTAFVPDEHHVLMAILLKSNLTFNQELAAAARVESITQSAHSKRHEYHDRRPGDREGRQRLRSQRPPNANSAGSARDGTHLAGRLQGQVEAAALRHPRRRDDLGLRARRLFRDPAGVCHADGATGPDGGRHGLLRPDACAN